MLSIPRTTISPIIQKFKKSGNSHRKPQHGPTNAWKAGGGLMEIVGIYIMQSDFINSSNQDTICKTTFSVIVGSLGSKAVL